jgi:hypothetical protein
VPRALLCVALLLVAGACQGSHNVPQPLTAESVTLQAKDVPGLQRCDASGDMATVLQDEKSSGSPSYENNAYEWTLWKRAGATEGYLAIYGTSAADCSAASGRSSGAPTGGLVVGLVVKFKNAASAARIYRTDADFLGFGPKDLIFIKSAGGTVTTGSQTGLGGESAVGSGLVAGATYYFALWQNKTFESDVLAYNLASADADKAVKNMNRRIQQP